MGQRHLRGPLFRVNPRCRCGLRSTGSERDSDTGCSLIRGVQGRSLRGMGRPGQRVAEERDRDSRRAGGSRLTRWTVVVVFVVAELWQLVFGAGTSLALANPRVGQGAAWVPNVLVGETYTILPLGFILCLWGAPWGRRLAAVCAAASIILAFPASVTVSARPLDVSEFAVYFALLAAPGLALMVCAVRMRRPFAGEVAS